MEEGTSLLGGPGERGDRKPREGLDLSGGWEDIPLF